MRLGIITTTYISRTGDEVAQKQEPNLVASYDVALEEFEARVEHFSSLAEKKGRKYKQLPFEDRLVISWTDGDTDWQQIIELMTVSTINRQIKINIE